MSTKDLDNNVHGSIHEILKLETTQMSINRKMDKHIMAYSWNELLLSNKKDWTTHAHNNLDESQKYFVTEESQLQKCTNYDYIYRKFKNR